MGFFNIFKSKKQKIKETKEKIQKDIKVDFSNFKKITDYIYKKSGIVDLDKRALTASRLQQYAKTQEVYNTDEFLNKMQNNIDFYQEILNIATVNETFFLREIKELQWLIEYIKRSNTKLNILSMPSSSGEEIYSILLMMLTNNISLDKVTIRGYDINSQAIQAAQNGIYDEHSLHKIDPETKNKYFQKTDEGSYEISNTIKQHTQFLQKNIFDLKNSSEKYDIILSRNMFIYFDESKRKEATFIIINMLKQNGIFIKGHADNIYEDEKLEKISFGIYKKT